MSEQIHGQINFTLGENGIRYTTSDIGLVIPIYLAPFFHTAGIIKGQLPDFLLSEEERIAAINEVGFKLARHYMMMLVEEFYEHSGRISAEAFLNRYGDYMDMLNIDRGYIKSNY